MNDLHIRRSKRDYSSWAAFTDLLFNLLIGFVYLFVLAFILINPITKKSDAPVKAEYMIILEWDETVNDDIDLWVRGPDGTIVSFFKSSFNYLNLEKDDLGHINDRYTENGVTRIIPINREVVMVRGRMVGEYKVVGHVYRRHIEDGQPLPGPSFMTVTIAQLNPYREHFVKQYTYHTKGQLITLINFTINSDLSFSNPNFLRYNFITMNEGHPQ